MSKPGNSSEVIKVLEDNVGIIHKLSFMYANSSEEVKDLRQEIIYQIVKSYKNFKGDSKISTWVYQVALFTALSYIKARKKMGPVNLEMPDLANPEKEDDRWHEVLTAIKKLPPIEKSLIFLYLENKSYSEMAKIMGMTESNIGVRLNRIKKKLKERLN